MITNSRRNPRYLSIPTLTVSLFAAYLASAICEANSISPVPTAFIYLIALFAPIVIKRTIFPASEEWKNHRNNQNNISRMREH